MKYSTFYDCNYVFYQVMVKMQKGATLYTIFKMCSSES